MNSNLSAQAQSVCARPGCNTPLTKSQKKYCGNTCAAQDRARVRALDSARSKLSATVHMNVDGDTQETVFSLMGTDGAVVLEEIALAISEKTPLPAPPLRKNLTDSGMDLGAYGIMVRKGKVYRPDDALSYDTIDDMLGCGQVLFALALKQSAIRSVLRNERSWKVVCSDSRMQETVRGIMAQAFRRHSKEFLEYMPYGAAFFEKQWDYQAGPHWGLDGVRGKLYGYRDLKAIHPRSIKWIDYKSNGHTFNGFTQEQNARRPPEAHVPTGLSLVLSYDKKWRNLWGTPAMEAVYPYWFWLEVATRSFLRYLERTGTPVTVVYAPMRGEITGPDGTRYPSMKYALIQAGYIAKSNAAAFPSDVDPETGNALWRVEYLSDDKRGDQFVRAIEVLGTMITRSLIIGDRAATQGDSAGSYAMAETHLEVTMLHNEMVLDELLEQVNEYLVTPLVRHNGSARTPPAHIETEGLDPAEKQRLSNLINTAGNAAGNALKMVDWRSIFEINNIPTLTDGEVEELYEKELERAVKHNETLAATAVEGKSPPKKEDSQGQRPVKKIEQSAEYIQHQIANGAQVPFMVSQEYAVEIVDRYGARPFQIALQETESDIEAMVEQILQELLAEETEPVSETEIEEVRDAIRAYLLGKTELELDGQIVSLEYDESIELGVGDFLKRAWAKVKRIANKIVKKVTGKSIKEWRTREPTSKTAITIRRADGTTYVWKEEDHPRDESGKFAKKEESVTGPSRAGETLTDIPKEQEKESGETEGPGVEGSGFLQEAKAFLSSEKYSGRMFSRLSGPGSGRTEEELDFALSERGIEVEAYGDVPHSFVVTAKGLMADTASDEYLSRTMTKNVFIITPDAWDEFSKEHGHLESRHGVRPGGGYWDQESLSLYIFYTGDASYSTHIAQHELLHTINRDTDIAKMSARAHASFAEESTVELLALRTLNDRYGIQEKTVYENWVDATAQFLLYKNDGDVDAAWKDVKQIHKNQTTTMRQYKMIMDEFPGLSAEARRAVRRSCMYSRATEADRAHPYSVAMNYALQEADPQSKEYEKLMKALGYSHKDMLWD